MKNFTFLCLTVLVSLGTFAAPKYLVETGEEGDATWSVSIDGATKVNLKTLNQSLDQWINETYAGGGYETWIAAGTYEITSGISVAAGSVNLIGGFAGTETTANQRAVGDEPWEMQNPTILDANGGVFYTVNSGNRWDGLTFINGSKADGGVACINANTTIKNCRFINNTSSNQGGALFTYRLTGIHILNCYFEGNSAPKGGAICVSDNEAGQTYEIDHCYFKDNNATGSNSGGAVRFENPGTYTINASVFDHNNGDGNGTAIAAVSTGDGVYTTISNCLIKNQQNDTKVAVLLYQGALLNNTFAHNAGGALYMGSTDLAGRIENNIIWGSNDAECNISMRNTDQYTLKNNALFKMINPSNVDKADNVRLYPEEADYFVDEANGDYHLSWKAKKMIGKGLDLTTDGVTADLDGKKRSKNDIGCYTSPWDIYSRSVNPEVSAYGTLCIPKDVHAGEFEGATFYRIAGTISGQSEIAIETVNELEAGHSYIFEINPGANMIRLNQTGSAAPTPIADNGLYGTYQNIEDLSVHLGSLEDIYVVYNGEIRLAGTNLKVPAKRAWIKMSEVRDALTEPQAQGSVRKRIPNASWQQGGATPLEQIMQTTGEEEIYDLLGRRVSSPVAGGIYIVNGQKVIIK
ncbi:MAG: hypothetical protein J6M55_04035 [Paludibacteraceae bacterium]|nr:hypothetical protein [Paludibacteraceae bacterium]